MRAVVLAALLLTNSAFATGVYVCKKSDGSVLYSQMPCPGSSQSEERRELDIRSPASSARSQPDLSAMAEEVASNNRRMEAERRLKSSERKIQALEEQRTEMVTRNTELANSIAGVNAANRSQAVIDKMNSEKARLDKAIDAEREKVNQARETLNSNSNSSLQTERRDDGGLRIRY